MTLRVENLDAVAVEEAFDALLAYCRARQWRGYDPFDGLNAPLLRFVPLPGKYGRIAWIQFFKRSPINFRPILGFPKQTNPMGHGLAVRALLARAAFARRTGGACDEHEVEALTLIEELDGMSSDVAGNLPVRGKAWGYPFDWQSRAFFVPKHAPSVVCTAVVAHAYLDAFDRWTEPKFLETARRSCDFILADLDRTYDDDRAAFCFSYTQYDAAQVHNASLLGAAVLARVFSHTNEVALRDAAVAAARYSVRRQRPDGSWPYGEASNQQWIDSFHTGFNLVALDEIRRFAGCDEFDDGLARGLRFFLDRFFLPDGSPKYYHDRLYPIDIHCPAQAFVTLARLKELETDSGEHLRRCLAWTLDRMRSREGYFYFRKMPWGMNRIPYLRWSQTWMLYGLSEILVHNALKS